METEGRQRPMCKTHSVEQAPHTIQEFPSNTTVSGWLCRALREAGDGSAAGPEEMRSTGIEPPTTRAPPSQWLPRRALVCATLLGRMAGEVGFSQRGNLVAHLQRPRFQLQRASGTQGRPQHFPEDPSDAMRVRNTCVLLREAAEQLFCHWDLVSQKLASDGPVTSRFAQTRPGRGRARVSRRAKGPGRPSRWEPSPPPSPPSLSLSLSLSVPRGQKT